MAWAAMTDHQGADHHKQAAHHHEEAAKHHHEAAKHHEEGQSRNGRPPRMPQVVMQRMREPT
jgi:hypothetical protein